MLYTYTRVHACACIHVCVFVVCYVCYTHVSNSIDSIDRQKTEKEREGELKREVTLYVGHSRVCRNFYNVEYLFYYLYIIFYFIYKYNRYSLEGSPRDRLL